MTFVMLQNVIAWQQLSIRRVLSHKTTLRPVLNLTHNIAFSKTLQIFAIQQYNAMCKI